MNQNGDFETAMQAALTAAGIRGVIVLVVDGDNITYLNAFGENAAREPLDAAAYVDIGRITDSFVTTLIMALVEQERLNHRVPLQNVLPDFELTSDQATANVTVTRLMNHSAGLGSPAHLAPLQPLPAQNLQDVQPHYYPGQRWSYCTRCYGLLVELLQTLTRQPVESLLYDTIFYPLEMDSTTVEQGRVISAAPDMAKFMSVYLQQGRWRDVQLLKPESVLTVQTGYIDTFRSLREKYGYGWFVLPRAGIEAAANEDEDRINFLYDIPENRAEMMLIPAQHRGILLISDQPTPGLDALMDIAAAEFLGWTPPAFEPPRDLRFIAGQFHSNDPVLGGDIMLEAVGDNLEITYNNITAPAYYVEERVIAFELESQQGRLFFSDEGRATNATLTLRGETAIFVRIN